jgi:hypothetical protein
MEHSEGWGAHPCSSIEIFEEQNEWECSWSYIKAISHAIRTLIASDKKYLELAIGSGQKTKTNGGYTSFDINLSKLSRMATILHLT